jgi:polar amino acid transport system substrate-binding protein
MSDVTRCFEVRRKVAAVLLAGGLAVHCGLTSAATDCRVSVRFTPSEAPLSMADARGEAIGVMPDALREVFRRMDCKVEFLSLPWARGLAMLKAGALTAVPGATRVAEREEYAYYSAEFSSDSALLYLRREDATRWRFTTLADLRDAPITVGVGINTIYSGEYGRLLQDPVFRSRLVPVGKTASMWKMLEAHRLDGVIAERLSAQRQLREAGLEDAVVPYAHLTIFEPAFVMFSKKAVSPEFVARFDATLAGFESDGSLAVVRRRYGAD